MTTYKKELQTTARQLGLKFFVIWVNHYIHYLNDNNLPHTPDNMLKFYNKNLIYGGK